MITSYKTPKQAKKPTIYPVAPAKKRKADYRETSQKFGIELFPDSKYELKLFEKSIKENFNPNPSISSISVFSCQPNVSKNNNAISNEAVAETKHEMNQHMSSDSLSSGKTSNDMSDDEKAITKPSSKFGMLAEKDSKMASCNILFSAPKMMSKYEFEPINPVKNTPATHIYKPQAIRPSI